MFKQLKFDCYKIFHSLSIQIVLAVCFSLCLMNPLIYAISWSDISMYRTMHDTSSIELVVLATVLFTTFLVGKDFSSGYLKNVYSSSNKAAYIFSKVICIFVFVVVFEIMYYLLFMLCNVAFGSRIIYQKPYDPGFGAIYGDTFNIGLVHAGQFTDGCIAFTFGMLMMFVLFATKNQWVALILGIVYFFFVNRIHGLVDTLLIKIFNPKKEFTIEKYLILQMGYWNWARIMNAAGKVVWLTKYALIFLGVLTFYNLLAIGGSYLVFAKRKVKV